MALLFIPELFLLASCLILFFLTVSRKDARQARNVAAVLAVANLIITAGSMGANGELFYRAYRVDAFSQLFKLLISGGLAILMLFGGELKGINKKVRPEYYLFLMISTMGLMMLVSSVELLTLFVALELSSFSLYILVPMRDDHGGMRSQMEAAVKYIMFGVMATGIMLYGMSYLFGLTGTTYLDYLVPALRGLGMMPAAVVGIAMFMAGLFFKLGVFPFHFWVPDVYQGASNETTAFIAAVPKVGAVAILIRIVMLADPNGQAIVILLTMLSICSMFYGNLVALVQKDIKRMLAFSGIAHAGYVLLGLVTMNEVGFANSIYYITGYLVMNLACFVVICSVSREGENLLIEDFAGLHKRSPLLALTLAVGMFGLAGIPPFVGFMGKFMLLTGALAEGHLPLVIMAAINTAISIYYYLSVVRVSYTADPEARPMVEINSPTRAVSLLLMFIIIALGIMPRGMIEIATQAVQSIM